MPNTYKKENKTWIFSAWHQNVAIAAWLLRGQNGTVLVSASKDGEIIAKSVEAMDIGTVRGSTAKQGGRALVEMMHVIRAGRIGLVTPDGPRGPCYHLQPGVIMLAQKTGAPIIPYHVEATRQWLWHKSWDQHHIPKPFSTIVVHAGEPYFVPESLSKDELEKVRKEFEQHMMDNVVAAKQYIERLK
ncbi:MAG: lysophospholipid acyltransferase family protein [Gammaproteobacteria bacterium]|nr:lysophospholipid acyltransferase family protein [Gammaproteobacteria bacterium]